MTAPPTIPDRLRRPAFESVRARRRGAALLFVGLVAAPLAMESRPAWAQPPEAQDVAVVTGSGPLETSITVEKLAVDTGPGGVEVRRWVPASRLNVGDAVYYTLRVHNPGKEPVTDIVVTKRLPFGVRYQRGSATGPACEIQFSTDGGGTFARPEPVAKATGAGKKSARKPPPEYSHVRWIFDKPLSPNATALLRFRATFS